MRQVILTALIFAAATLAAQGPAPLVHEAIVNAPVDEVWAAFTTTEGLESWMAAHAQIELKIGGRWLTQYDPKATLGDPSAIENVILSYDPKRMLSFKVAKAPSGFPFPNAVKNMWTVIYFDDVAAQKTRVREISLGFGDDDESKKMRDFFDRGNAATLQHLQKRFAGKPEGWR